MNRKRFKQEVRRRVRRDRGPVWMRWLARCAPRALIVVCPSCGPALRREVRVPLPVMAQHRREVCTSESCAVYRRRFGLHWCGTPAPLRFIKLNWLRRAVELGCGCLLNVKWWTPFSRCPYERF